MQELPKKTNKQGKPDDHTLTLVFTKTAFDSDQRKTSENTTKLEDLLLDVEKGWTIQVREKWEWKIIGERKMFETTNEYLQLQIRMTALKGEHGRLAAKFNENYKANKRGTPEYVDLFKALQSLHTRMQKVGWDLYTYKLRPKSKKNFLK